MEWAAQALTAASLPSKTRSYVYLLRDHPSLPTTMVTGSHEPQAQRCGPDLALQVSILGQPLPIGLEPQLQNPYQWPTPSRLTSSSPTALLLWFECASKICAVI